MPPELALKLVMLITDSVSVKTSDDSTGTRCRHYFCNSHDVHLMTSLLPVRMYMPRWKPTRLPTVREASLCMHNGSYNGSSMSSMGGGGGGGG